MYLWKYWRDSSLVLAFGIFFICLIAWFEARSIVLNAPINYSESGDAAANVYRWFVDHNAPFVLIAWILGQFGAGREISRRCGTYLFALPRPRRFVVWSDWLMGTTSLAILVVSFASVTWVGIRLGAIDGLVSGPHRTSAFSLNMSLAIVTSSVFLCVSFVYGLTYFLTVFLKSPTGGLTVALGMFVTYQLLAGYCFAHYGIRLPAGLLNPFQPANAGVTAYAVPHMGLLLALRALLLLVFPLATQVAMQKTDI